MNSFEDFDNTFNYSSFLKSGPQRQYNSYMNDRYIELNGMTVYVFKLDKVLTKKSELYGSEVSSRIYLPHFPIRALYLTNKWAGQLSLNVYEEDENNIDFTMNFDRMVKTHRDLKEKISGELSVYYTGNGTPYIEKKNSTIKFAIDTNIVFEEDLNNPEINTIKKLVTKINSLQGFSSVYTGNNESSINLDNFINSSIKNITKKINVRDKTYANITDVIEMGDVILTDKYRLYQVLQANPAGDIGWNYSTYFVKGNLCDMSLVDSLPNDYRKIINDRQYGLNKIRKE